jgi:hypothetical protein
VRLKGVLLAWYDDSWHHEREEKFIEKSSLM